MSKRRTIMVEIQRCIFFFFKSLLDIVCWVSEQELALLAIEKSLQWAFLTEYKYRRHEILVVGHTRITSPAILLVWPEKRFTSDKFSDLQRWHTPKSVLAMEYVLHRNWVPTVRKCTSGVGLPHPTGKWTSGDTIFPETFAQWSIIFMFLSVLMCAGLYFIPENQGHLCVWLSLSLIQVHTWIIRKESVIHPYRQRNEAGYSQTT